MYARHEDAGANQHRAAETEAARDGKIVQMYGGDQLKILNFAADASVVHAGERLGICYGVSNAVKVKIEPGVEPLKPALTHCIQALPKKTTTYTLTAIDAAGHAQTASLTVQVR